MKSGGKYRGGKRFCRDWEAMRIELVRFPGFSVLVSCSRVRGVPTVFATIIHE